MPDSPVSLVPDRAAIVTLYHRRTFEGKADAGTERTAARAAKNGFHRENQQPGSEEANHPGAFPYNVKPQKTPHCHTPGGPI